MVQKLVDGRGVRGRVSFQSDLRQNAISHVHVQINPLHQWTQQIEQLVQLPTRSVVIQGPEVLNDLCPRDAAHAQPRNPRSSREHYPNLKNARSRRQKVQTSGDLASQLRIQFAAKQKRQ